MAESTPRAELSGADDVNKKREMREERPRIRTIPGRKLDFWVSLPPLVDVKSSVPESSARGVDSALGAKRLTKKHASIT